VQSLEKRLQKLVQVHLEHGGEGGGG